MIGLEIAIYNNIHLLTYFADDFKQSNDWQSGLNHGKYVYVYDQKLQVRFGPLNRANTESTFVQNSSFVTPLHILKFLL